MADKDSSFQRAFDSAAFIRTSRMLMMLGTLIGLPVAGWYMQRLVASQDRMTDTVSQSSLQLKLLEQSVRLEAERRGDQLNAIKEIVVDHEGRIRVLEQKVEINPRRSPN